MRRYLRVTRVFLAATLSAGLEYRINFVAALLSSLGNSAVALLGLSLFYSRSGGGTLGGWSYPQALLVVGFFMLAQGFISVVLQPNLNKIAEAIRTGTMDFTLLKPIDAQWSVSTRNLNLLRLGDVLVGVAILIWALLQLDGVRLGGVLLSALLFFCALMSVYSVWFMLSTTAFWLVKTENITELFNGVFGAARFPVAAFPAPVQLALTFVIPVAFVTTVPAQAVTGSLSPTLGLLAPLIALLLFLGSRLFWRHALASYTSASS
ncbi:ABC transporter permease [Deinococcus sonorensis]|uniref:ABC-2 family transporter protein n=2 Tax=Deinococcus sonorensis TaxID=309891 RepID=A0AAU7U982_9DEIO